MTKPWTRPASTSSFRAVLGSIDNHPLAAGLGLAIMLVVVGITAVVARRLIRALVRRRWIGEQVITVLAAAIATGVSAQGMWVFMGDALHLTYLPRAAFFAFLEVMVVQSALRARAAQRDGGSPGVDGLAMWALTGLSAGLSATEADNLGMLLLRLSAPIVAAWGWERSMALERRRHTGTRSRINWRITPERLLIRFGLADPTPNPSAPDFALRRNIIAVAFAVDDARTIRDSARASARQVRRAHRRVREAMRRAASDGGMVPFDGRDHRDVLIDYIAVLHGTSRLIDFDAPNPFDIAVRTGSQRCARESLAHSVDHRPRAADNSAHTEPGEASPMRSAAQHVVPTREPRATHSDNDPWSEIAEKVCAEHPTRRRHRAAVEAVLRLHHTEDQTYPEIARSVGLSKHAVGRVIRQARPYYPARAATTPRGGDRDAA